MEKNKTAPATALGFRIKSGWAASVLLAGPIKAPQILDCRRIELADAAVPGSRQPYHASMGKLQTDEKKIELLRVVVFRVAQQSVTKLMQELQQAGRSPVVAGIVVGSDTDPARITNPHIRAHALEGRLFRTALAQELESAALSYSTFLERTLYADAAKKLRLSEEQIKQALTKLGRDLEVPWRVDEKAACLAAWLSLA